MTSTPLVRLLFGSGLPAFGYRFLQQDLEARTTMVRQILAAKGAVPTAGPSVTLVEVEPENTVYLLTEPGHFAHPSILKRALVASSDGRRVEVSGFTVAAPETMSTWMAQFEQQDSVTSLTPRP